MSVLLGSSMDLPSPTWPQAVRKILTAKLVQWSFVGVGPSSQSDTTELPREPRSHGIVKHEEITSSTQR